MQNEKSKLNIVVVISILIDIILVPLTIYISFKYFNRSYYLSSLVIILLTLLSFFISFEKSRPKISELVIIAVMTAISVASRAVFVMLPSFKPMTAIIIITGIALGPQAGFLTGALSAFISNFIFGQGPWTPWQMLAFGAAGLIAGLIYKNKSENISIIKLCIFGAVLVMLFVGPMLDTCTLFTMTEEVNSVSAKTVYISGLPFNAIHALATVLTLCFAAKPLLTKLDRIKLKYGMMENET